MLITKTAIPRLAPFTIRRTRLETRLGVYRQAPVRLVVGPSGSGKSTLLLTYAQSSDARFAYCAVSPGCSAQRLRETLAAAADLSSVPASYGELVDALCGTPAQCLEVAVDDIDDASDEALSELLSLVEDVRENVTLIYAARSRERIAARRFIARGLGEICDARHLAFTVDEAELYAQACDAPYTAMDVKRLVHETDGWPLALCAAVRCAAAERIALSAAYAQWRRESTAFLQELIDGELDRVSEEDRALFVDLLGGRGHGDALQLRRLESEGLFIHDDGASLRPYRVFSAIPTKSAAADEEVSKPPLVVHLFRTFEAKLGGRDIPWVRRRDQQIVKYLLLKPDGRATRSELASVFWSDTERHLATQSVRTACSTIRKAFAAIVGYAAVDSYFRTVPDVQIDLQHVVCDVRRFSAHVTDAESCSARGDRDGEAMHYRAAEKLYAGRLLEFEAGEPWFGAQARALEERYVSLLERLAQLAFEQDEPLKAQQYARRAQALQPDLPGAHLILERAAFTARTQRRARVESGTLETVATLGSA